VVAFLRRIAVAFLPLLACAPAWAETSLYKYNIQNQLVEVTRGGDILLRLQYDSEGRLIKKIGEEGIRQYRWDGRKLLVEYDGDGNPICRYFWAGDRLQAFDRLGEGTRFPIHDGLGSVVGLTDEAGNKVAGYHLDAWGNFRFPAELDASRNKIAYTGYILDRETGLYFAQARHYDPSLGRFITQDSFMGRIEDVPSLHRYVYSRGNPATFVDPSGHESYRQLIMLDKPSPSVGHEFLKHFGYEAFNVISFGALARQDRLVELSEAGKLTEVQYHQGTAINVVGTGATAAATFASGGVAGQVVARAGGSLALAGAASGGAAGLVASTGSADVDMAMGTRSPLDVHPTEFVAPTALGAAAGAAFGAGSAKAQAVVEGSRGGELVPAEGPPLLQRYTTEGAPSAGVSAGRLQPLEAPSSAGTVGATPAERLAARTMTREEWQAYHQAQRLGRTVNPTQGMTNCVNCTIAADSTLGGRPASALPSRPKPLAVLERQYGGTFQSFGSPEAIAQQMAQAGSGARGIVYGTRGPGQVGHVFNVVNQQGQIRFIDAQTGEIASFEGYQSFGFLRTR
jgi:RHS repeat-associated protein